MGQRRSQVEYRSCGVASAACKCAKQRYARGTPRQGISPLTRIPSSLTLFQCAELDVLPSDAPAAIARMAKIVQWKADLQACFESRAAADDAANVSLLPSSVTLELLESRYKELDCIIPDHKRLEPLLRDYKRWRERHKPWSEFFLWCKAARAGCFLSGDGYDPFSTSLPSLTSPAPSSLPSKRVKSEELIPLASSAVGERRRRSGIEVAPTSATTAGKKSGKEVVSKRAEEEETDNTLYRSCMNSDASNVLEYNLFQVLLLSQEK
jgi:hypothetical protein